MTGVPVRKGEDSEIQRHTEWWPGEDGGGDGNGGLTRTAGKLPEARREEERAPC